MKTQAQGKRRGEERRGEDKRKEEKRRGEGETEKGTGEGRYRMEVGVEDTEKRNERERLKGRRRGAK